MKQDNLWREIQRGNEHAFRQLYQDNADVLFNYGIQIIENEDLVAETIKALFIHLYEHRTSIKQPTSTRTYLTTSLRKLLLLEIKKINNDA